VPRSHLSFDWLTSRHCEEGRRDLESCSTCHDTRTPTCARCHRGGD
jgi:hypothetical protein